MTNTPKTSMELITPEMKKVLDKMFPQVSRTYSHYDVERVLEAIIPIAQQANNKKWVIRLERNYFYGKRDGLDEALLMTEGEIIEKSKECQNQAKKLTDNLLRKGLKQQSKPNPPTKDWKEEFRENVDYDEAELGCNWGMDELETFIEALLATERSKCQCTDGEYTW